MSSQKSVTSDVIVLEMNKKDKQNLQQHHHHHQHQHPADQKKHVAAEPVICTKSHPLGIKEQTLPPVYCDLLQCEDSKDQNIDKKAQTNQIEEIPIAVGTSQSFDASPIDFSFEKNEKPEPKKRDNKDPKKVSKNKNATMNQKGSAKTTKQNAKNSKPAMNDNKTFKASNRPNYLNRPGSAQSNYSVSSTSSRPSTASKRTRPPLTNKKLHDSFESSLLDLKSPNGGSSLTRSNSSPRRSNSISRRTPDIASSSLNSEAFSSINPRRLASGKIAFAYEEIPEVVDELNKFPKYAVSGYKVLMTEKLGLQGVKFDEEKIGIYESLFRKHLFLQILLTYKENVKYEMLESTSDCLNKLFRDFLIDDGNAKDAIMNQVIEAAEKSAKMLKYHIGDRLELASPLPDNKLGLSGLIDFLATGKDRLESKYVNLIAFKMGTEKHVLSKYVLELFLQGVILDIPNVYMLYFHGKDSTLVLYEFKFRYDKLRDYNKTLKVHQIFENFFKGAYGHSDCKIVYKESRDMEITQRK